MTKDELRAKAARLEAELSETRTLLDSADPEELSSELARTRSYAFSAAGNINDVVSGCSNSIARNGFCVVDNVIPREVVDEIRDEAVAAGEKVKQNIEGIRSLFEKGVNAETLLNGEAEAHNVAIRRVRKMGYPPKPPNDIVWMPKYAEHLANPVITAVARNILDDHLRIAQLHSRHIDPDKTDGYFGGGSRSPHRGRSTSREWHTDWPHDLSAYGRDDPKQNAGCIRQPFPDVTMCLVMIWYLTDVDEHSGGTWVVPGSHRDKRNPRGPSDGITVSAPIPGDMQVSAPAGSVYIQDSRSWHASAMHNPSGRARVAIVNRWCPWWLSVDDFAPGDVYSANTVCRPLSHEEYLALPTDLQPLMRHLCPDEHDTLQQPILDRSREAGLRNEYGFEQDPEAVTEANAHIRVPLHRQS